ncbi:hypothetical protein ASG04_14560 [Curtobacterium sp. Leaf183]|uniref:BREX-2 system adenine-specific DNA-methyltransferase PglX n=1 Tax=Curtobacterium sp. Leaf183 TaxID=1736291 RepID=UPI0006F2B9DD|nr:BREX-2 system adenine-specific DNA-methyltransferase PglX [Curtobacterium sp. Leaf183]KQS08324.1 hypothetical protein ASG04_14560 [Curtobacterium sp. Leaf183]
MIDSAALLADLQRQLKLLQTDLTLRAEDEADAWGTRLRDEHRRASARERTGKSWIDWRDGEVAQAAVTWILACVFIRFAEDNDLLAGAKRDGTQVSLPWLAGPDDGLDRAVENEAAFYAATPTATSRDWLKAAFSVLTDLPAGRPLVDPDHSAVWHAPISASAADGLRDFFRRTRPDGTLVHNFSDSDLGTRFLGDLYQDLSDYAKKTYALLQTPDFVEEFILDLTLTPAIAEFGLTGLKLIDPACGSGHFLLGAFERLVANWAEAAPAVDKGARVQKALDSIHGVDLNPFAIAIARFRLTVAALRASGLTSLVGSPAFRYHLAIGDSLLGSVNPNAGFDLGDDEYFEYSAEDLRDYQGILEHGQYHVVVANPPYIQPPDAKLRDTYRALYSTCRGKYALSVPFMELLFRLAKRPNASGAGYVGQITSNSFMKREFGKNLIEKFLSGGFTGLSPEHVDLSHIIDTSGAYIPGHGTPTVILAGRPRKPQSDFVRAVLGVRGEPGQPAVPAEGLVWRDILDHLDQPGYEGPYVSVADMLRSSYAQFPWSLSGGGTADVRALIDGQGERRLSDVVESIGFTAITGLDDFHVRNEPSGSALWESIPTRSYVEGESVRDWRVQARRVVLDPYADSMSRGATATYWPYRRALNAVIFFGKTPSARGHWWGEFAFVHNARLQAEALISFAFVSTHNHFVLVNDHSVMNKSAPVIKLPEGATEDDHYDLLGVLNSSVACFWLKQVSHNKGSTLSRDGARTTLAPWEDFFEFTGTKLQEFPLPRERERDLARRIDLAARERDESTPSNVLAADGPSELEAAEPKWRTFGREMTFLQEELDWRTYAAYGLVDAELAPKRPDVVAIEPNERAFEIKLARTVAAGETKTAWFERHGRSPLIDLPEAWPVWYRDLVERRLEAMETNSSLRLLEQPEYKRRWAGASWETLVAGAIREVILDQLEAPELWQDASGRPVVRSVAQLADTLRHDERLRELLAIHTGSQDFDLSTEIGRLIEPEAVPAFAPQRYKSSGLEKFRSWEHIWELQRAEDRGERVDVPVPPKYKPVDFVKVSYWSARGKLDVPKERFIAFPGSHYPEDSTGVYGWAGWDHSERGQAVARLANQLSRAGASDQQVVPLVGVLLELEPWLRHWHDEIDPRTGVSPATAVAGITTTLLGRLGLGSDVVLAWRPEAPARGRRSSS